MQTIIKQIMDRLKTYGKKQIPLIVSHIILCIKSVPILITLGNISFLLSKIDSIIAISK